MGNGRGEGGGELQGGGQKQGARPSPSRVQKVSTLLRPSACGPAPPQSSAPSQLTWVLSAAGCNTTTLRTCPTAQFSTSSSTGTPTCRPMLGGSAQPRTWTRSSSFSRLQQWARCSRWVWAVLLRQRVRCQVQGKLIIVGLSLRIASAGRNMTRVIV